MALQQLQWSRRAIAKKRRGSAECSDGTVVAVATEPSFVACRRNSLLENRCADAWRDSPKSERGHPIVGKQCNAHQNAEIIDLRIKTGDLNQIAVIL